MSFSTTHSGLLGVGNPLPPPLKTELPSLRTAEGDAQVEWGWEGALSDQLGPLSDAWGRCQNVWDGIRVVLGR